jgi:hypothetical protein
MDALPSVRRRTCERTFVFAPGVADLPIPELVENRRRRSQCSRPGRRLADPGVTPLMQ